MIVWMDDDLFRSGGFDVDRIALLRGACTRRHTLIVSNNPRDTRTNRQKPAFDAWLESLPARLQAEIRLLVQRLAIVTANAVARGAERLLVSSQPWPNVPGCLVTLEEAIRAVSLPTYVLVENALNDGAFLRRAMPPVWATKLDQWERQGILQYQHAGGNTVMRQILEYFADDDNSKRAFGLPTRLWRLVHVLVYDNDGNNENAKKLNNACITLKMGLRSHRLHRNDQEHYLPLEALKAIAGAEKRPGTGDYETIIAALDTHFQSGANRNFAELPYAKMFKSAFCKYENKIIWSDEWFAKDGAWPEMTLVAEMIAGAI